jgi:hypothetical protein
MMEHELISRPTCEALRRELDRRAGEVESRITEIYAQDESRAADEMRVANRRLIAGEKSSIEKALSQGMISARAAANLLEEADRRLEQMVSADERK